jgi:hypothetical protein
VSGRSSPTLDAELARCVDEQARLADALAELEHHPGLRLLQSATPTGVTALRWAAVQELLPKLWTDLATHRAVVADACAVRTRRSRPGEREWTELHTLLMTPTAAASTIRVTAAETLTPRELAARMDGRIREVAEVLDAVEAVHLAALAGLGPLVERVHDARNRAGELLGPDDPDGVALAALTDAVDARLRTCTDDPLSLPAPSARHLADGLDGDLDRIEERLAEVAAARAAWTGGHAAAAGAVAALDPLWDRAERARREALDRVADADLAAPADPRPALRHRLAALPAQRPDADALAALPGLARDAQAAAETLRAAAARAAGLTDRRAELGGRFAAYRAKALRVGASDDPQVVALTAQIRALLGAPRTDLPALTRALHAYQERVNG